ncbi:protein kinase [Candidatus Berkiella cookevillensis]|uniref:Protein kinase n=1 Tax=Candidatus Berkiella cookevillensis TaxID=437022 RepID=A0A0Q9YG42_9GAMM|nr:protein kinase [Candidatus Berkiella cookevillensis]MCS5707512.1 protein kinase [Candidatus Berkiella cookevillensis]
MANNGASAQSNVRLDAENPQIKTLKDNLKETINLLKSGTIDPLFRELGFHSRNDIAFVLEDIELQLYKFYNRMPGELIKLSSMITPPLGITIYATRDASGAFQIILHKAEQDISYQITKPPHLVWQQNMALATRMNFLSTQAPPPAHLTAYIEEDLANYFDSINENMDAIKNLKKNTSLAIPADATKNRNHDIEVLCTASGEYKVLAHTNHPDAPYIELDNIEKCVWHKKNELFLDSQAIEFLENIAKTKDKLDASLLPAAFNQLISKSAMLDIYQYMLNNPYVVAQLTRGEGFRISKEFSTLIRTLNIVRDPNGDYMLMLETKRKLADGSKDGTRMIGKGTFGTVKPAWRIDCFAPEEWVNKVSKGESAQEADYEALFSQKLINSHELGQDKADTLNVTLLGELFTSKDVVKRSQYSKRAIGDLKQVIDNPNIILSPADKTRITQNILEGIALMHAQGKVHQDIKLPNVFIYRDERGYYAKIADFGISYDPQSPLHKPSLASGGYESPEIVLANEAPDAAYHGYYHESAFIAQHSYGYKINRNNMNRAPTSAEALNFREPHPANDMWALGILLFELNHGHLPRLGYSQDELKIQNDPLLRGLLAIKREDRISCVDAIKLSTINLPEQSAPLLFGTMNSHMSAPSTAITSMTTEAIDYSECKNLLIYNFLELAKLSEPTGRQERDKFIKTLEKLRTADPILFNFVLEGQSIGDLKRIIESLNRYTTLSLSTSTLEVKIYPHLIRCIDNAIENRHSVLLNESEHQQHCQSAKTKGIEHIDLKLDKDKRGKLEF